MMPCTVNIRVFFIDHMLIMVMTPGGQDINLSQTNGHMHYSKLFLALCDDTLMDDEFN